jgi:hypothetical protein
VPKLGRRERPLEQIAQLDLDRLEPDSGYRRARKRGQRRFVRVDGEYPATVGKAQREWPDAGKQVADARGAAASDQDDVRL